MNHQVLNAEINQLYVNSIYISISPSIEVPSTIRFNLSGELTFPVAIASLFPLNILLILEREDSEFEINVIVSYIKVFGCLFKAQFQTGLGNS